MVQCNMAEHILTSKETDFIAAYIVDMDIKRAAIKAGYSKTSAYHSGKRVLGKPNVQDMIKKMKERSALSTQCTFEWKVNKLMELAQTGTHDVTIRAIAELNKMQGHLAPTRNINLNINETIESVQSLGIEYKYA